MGGQAVVAGTLRFRDCETILYGWIVLHGCGSQTRGPGQFVDPT